MDRLKEISNNFVSVKMPFKENGNQLKDSILWKLKLKGNYFYLNI